MLVLTKSIFVNLFLDTPRLIAIMKIVKHELEEINTNQQADFRKSTVGHAGESNSVGSEQRRSKMNRWAKMGMAAALVVVLAGAVVAGLNKATAGGAYESTGRLPEVTVVGEMPRLVMPTVSVVAHRPAPSVGSYMFAD